jgi:hypothetical protein
MTAGMSVKSMIGMVVLIIGVSTFSTPNVLENAIADSMQAVRTVLSSPVPVSQ